MKLFFRGVFRVITGGYNKFTNKNSELAKQRLQVCMECDKKIKMGRKDGICSICGCVLSVKSRVEEEKCSLGKW